MTGLLLEGEPRDLVVDGGDFVPAERQRQSEQDVACVMGTRQGEWFLNRREGMDFKVILQKNPDFDQVQDQVRRALRQVDETFVLQAYAPRLEGRCLVIEFEAAAKDGKVAGVERF